MRSRTDLGGPKEREEHPEQGEGEREAERGAQERQDERTSRSALALRVIIQVCSSKRVQNTAKFVLLPFKSLVANVLAGNVYFPSLLCTGVVENSATHYY